LKSLEIKLDICVVSDWVNILTALSLVGRNYRPFSDPWLSSGDDSLRKYIAFCFRTSVTCLDWTGINQSNVATCVYILCLTLVVFFVCQTKKKRDDWYTCVTSFDNWICRLAVCVTIIEISLIEFIMNEHSFTTLKHTHLIW
jgi:hypothetical protein